MRGRFSDSRTTVSWSVDITAQAVYDQVCTHWPAPTSKRNRRETNARKLFCYWITWWFERGARRHAKAHSTLRITWYTEEQHIPRCAMCAEAATAVMNLIAIVIWASWPYPVLGNILNNLTECATSRVFQLFQKGKVLLTSAIRTIIRLCKKTGYNDVFPQISSRFTSKEDKKMANWYEYVQKDVPIPAWPYPVHYEQSEK